jgi:FLVCR family MFS transporter 7
MNGEAHHETDDIVVYSYRWLILFLFCFLVIANALMWVSFAPISDIASHYFGSGVYGSDTAINMMANVFLILYAPGTFIASMSIKRYGVRRSLIIAGSTTAFGALIRVFGAWFHDDIGNATTYFLMLLGQCLGSIAQPMFLNLPPTISSIWFPTFERDITTTVGALSSPIGNAIGAILPVIFVSETIKNKG